MKNNNSITRNNQKGWVCAYLERQLYQDRESPAAWVTLCERLLKLLSSPWSSQQHWWAHNNKIHSNLRIDSVLVLASMVARCWKYFGSITSKGFHNSSRTTPTPLTNVRTNDSQSIWNSSHVTAYRVHTISLRTLRCQRKTKKMHCKAPLYENTNFRTEILLDVADIMLTNVRQKLI
jgi:hypothetical protein